MCKRGTSGRECRTSVWSSPEPQRISIFVPTNHYHIVALLCLNVSYSVVIIVRTSVICVNTPHKNFILPLLSFRHYFNFKKWPKLPKPTTFLFSIFGATAHPDRTSDSYVTLKKKRIKRKLAKMDPVLLIRGPTARLTGPLMDERAWGQVSH